MNSKDITTEPSGASAAEIEAKGELVVGQLCGNDLSVPVTNEWRSSAIKALRDGDFDTWAEKTLSAEDWQVWQDLDPKLKEVEAFFATINSALGTSPGKSRASRK